MNEVIYPIEGKVSKETRLEVLIDLMNFIMHKSNANKETVREAKFSAQIVKCLKFIWFEELIYNGLNKEMVNAFTKIVIGEGKSFDRKILYKICDIVEDEIERLSEGQ